MYYLVDVFKLLKKVTYERLNTSMKKTVFLFFLILFLSVIVFVLNFLLRTIAEWL